MNFTEDLIQSIKDEANKIFVQIVSGYTPLKARKPNDYWGKSPFVNEKTPSFHVRDDHKFFKCFSSGKSGDIITFIQEINGMSFHAAIIYLSELVNIDISKQSNTDEYNNINSIIKYNTRIQYEIQADTNFLENRIGIPDYDYSVWGQGYATESSIPKSKLSIDAGFYKDEPKNTVHLFVDRDTLPIRNMYGKIVAFAGRTRQESKDVQKWINSHNTVAWEKKKTLYGLHIAKKHITQQGFAIVVEGYIDCIASHAVDEQNTVATMGANVSLDQARILRIFTDSVVMYYDGDAAGKKGMLQSIPVFLQTGFKSISIRLITEPGKDPSDFPDYVVMEWYDFVVSEISANTPEEKVKLAKMINETYLSKMDPISANVYSDFFYEKYNIKTPKIEEKFPDSNSDESMEDNILSKLILEKDSYLQIFDILKKGSFSTEPNNIIYETLIDMVDKSIPIDKLTTIECLYQNGNINKIGGVEYVNSMLTRYSSGANTIHYARIVAQRAMKRELATICNSVIENAHNPQKDPIELLEQTNESIRMIGQTQLNKLYYEMPELVKEAIGQINEAAKNKSGIIGIGTGLSALDNMTKGFLPGQLITVAARPAMGKTAWLISASLDMASNKIPVGVFSMEMTALEFTMRYLTAHSGINANSLKTGSLTEMQWNDLLDYCDFVHRLPIYIDDTSGISILELKTRARKMKYEQGIQILFVDYLQLIRGSSGKTREQEISEVSRSLKQLAKELGIPVVALAQLSRSVESRGGDKKPMLSDIRESGGIEQDSDLVMFLYRAEYYGFEVDEMGESTKGMAEIIIAKQRSGSTGSVTAKFNGATSKFSNL